MPGTAGPNLGLFFGYSPHDDGWGVEGYNPAMGLLDGLINAVVQTIGNAAPPGSPTAGDRYVIGASASGAWSGHDGAFTIYRDSAWKFYAPKSGWRVFNVADGKYWRFSDPNWIDDTPSLVSLTDVVISGTLSSGEALVYDGSKFTNTVPDGGVTKLDDLSDVGITTSSLANGQTLVYNSSTSNFENSTVSGGGATDLNGLSDVDITTSSLANGQTLVYDSATSQFKNAVISGGVSSLDDLSDVTITSATSGQALIYNGSAFVNAVVSGGGGGSGLFADVLSAGPPTQSSTGLTTWVNQGTASVSDNAHGLRLTAPATIGDSVRMLKKTPPATPYTYSALISISAAFNNYQSTGIGFRNGTDKIHVMNLSYGDGNRSVNVNRYSNETTYSGAESVSTLWAGDKAFLQIENDGTDLHFRYSSLGDDWIQLLSIALASSYLGASGYTEFIFWANRNNNGGASPLISTLMWLDES